MNRKVEVFPDKSALLKRALELTVAQISKAIEARGRCTIVLSGGNTPEPLYKALATQSLPWEKIHVFWGDERYVPPEHPDSNAGMARRALLEQIDIPTTNIHPMPTNEAEPEVAAQNYEAHLQKFFQLQAGEFPAFDLILLGMGDDGHTASLFPHTQALQVRDRLITVGSKNAEPRLTFTAPLINQAHCVIFLVTGANKRSALDQVFASVPDDATYPARLIQPQGELWWLLDQAAGQDLQLEIAK